MEVERQVCTLHQGPPGDAGPDPRLGDTEPLVAACGRPPDRCPHAAGTCTNDQKDECRLPGGTVVASCSDMSGHWKVTYPGQPSCHGPPPTSFELLLLAWIPSSAETSQTAFWGS